MVKWRKHALFKIPTLPKLSWPPSLSNTFPISNTITSKVFLKADTSEENLLHFPLHPPQPEEVVFYLNKKVGNLDKFNLPGKVTFSPRLLDFILNGTGYDLRVRPNTTSGGPLEVTFDISREQNLICKNYFTKWETIKTEIFLDQWLIWVGWQINLIEG